MAYLWWKLLHIVGVVGFLLSHGVSVTVGLLLRRERDRARIRELLQVSGSSVRSLYGSLVVLLVGGTAAGFVGHWWSYWWIWASLGILIGVTVVMLAIAKPFYKRIAEAVKLRPSGVPRTSDEELDALLTSARPALVTWIGFSALLVILYLMVMKPT